LFFKITSFFVPFVSEPAVPTQDKDYHARPVTVKQNRRKTMAEAVMKHMEDGQRLA